MKNNLSSEYPKVLFIRNAEFFGGAEIYSLRIMKGLVQKNQRGVLWTNNDALWRHSQSIGVTTRKKYLGPIIKNKASFLFFILTYPLLFFYYLTIIFILKIRGRVDILHLNSLNDFLLFTSIGKLLGLRVVWTVDVAFYPKNNWLLRFLFILSSLMADEIIAMSVFMRNNIIGNGVDPTKILLIYNGVEKKEKEIANFEDNPQKTITIAFIGKISKEKGIFTFLKAAREVIKQIPLVEFWVVGDAPESMKRENTQWKGKIIFKGWYDDLSIIYKNTDVVVVPSIVEESFGFVAAEAMMFGKAVVVSNRGALPELVNAESGIVFSAGDSFALSGIILSLVRNPLSIKTLGEKAHARAEELFSLERMAEATLQVYKTKK